MIGPGRAHLPLRNEHESEQRGTYGEPCTSN
jgi:hypothetical protein